MKNMEKILEFNKQFVETEQYESYRTSRYPDRKMVILTCMDTRLQELLTKSMNLQNGDAKVIRNAGAIVLQPFGNVMRSILVAVYELNAEEVCVIGHHDCGMTGLNSEKLMQKMQHNGIQNETFEILKNAGIDLSSWLKGFDNLEESVKNSVKIINQHPLLPKNLPVHGLLIHPETGKLDWIVNGYEQQ